MFKLARILLADGPKMVASSATLEAATGRSQWPEAQAGRAPRLVKLDSVDRIAHPPPQGPTREPCSMRSAPPASASYMHAGADWRDTRGQVGTRRACQVGVRESRVDLA